MDRPPVQRGYAFRIAVFAILSLCAIARGAEDFNEQRLEEGRIAYKRKDFVEAIDEFRVAAFGSLDRPDRLSECFARLALAQNAAGQAADAKETLSRFLDAEVRFGAYAKVNLEPDIRSEFQALLARSVSATTLAGVPSLANVVETDEQKAFRLPPLERRKALRAYAKSEPNSVRWQLALARDAIERGDEGEAKRFVSKALSMDPANAEARALQARFEPPSERAPQTAPALQGKPTTQPKGETEVAAGGSRARASGGGSGKGPAGAQGVLEESRRLVSASRAGEAVPLLTNALKVEPENRELRLALLEAACLSRSYGLAVAQLPMSTPFSEGEATSSFYAAVALYETGRGNDARDFLKRALPRVSGPLVDEYSRKILESSR